MVRYMKCPRCELNYIDAEKQEYCDICLKEMKGIPLDDEDIEEAEEEIASELCPVCGENMMRPGEKMCDECRKKSEFEEEPDPEGDDEWREYLDDDTDSELDAELGESLKGEFDASLEDEEEEEEEFVEEEEEDLEYVTGDEIYSISDDEDDEDDDEDDDF